MPLVPNTPSGSHNQNNPDDIDYAEVDDNYTPLTGLHNGTVVYTILLSINVLLLVSLKRKRIL